MSKTTIFLILMLYTIAVMFFGARFIPEDLQPSWFYIGGILHLAVYAYLRSEEGEARDREINS